MKVGAVIPLGAAILASPAVGRPALLSVGDVSSAVVFIHANSIEKRVVNGVPHEVWLRSPGAGSGPTPHVVRRMYATGFFVTDGKLLFLVTAQHVARTAKADTQATVWAPGDTPLSIPLANLGGVAPRWTTHPEADVAVMLVRPDPSTIAQLQGRFLPLDVLVADLAAPDRSVPLTVVGFPRELGVEKRFSPLTLETRAASGLLRLPRLDTGQLATVFVLQDPSIGGYSGAPVFDLGVYKGGGYTISGKRPRCYGLVHGTLGDTTGGKLGVVMHSVAIRETIDLAVVAP